MTKEQLEALRVWVQHEVAVGVVKALEKAYVMDGKIYYHCDVWSSDHAFDVVKGTFGIVEDSCAEDHH